MRGFVFGFVGTVALAAFSSGVAAQPVAEGLECRPPLASPEGFQDCRTRIAAGQVLCRCRVVPGLDAARRSPVNEAVSALTPRRETAPAGAAASLR
ncbi:MAG TPA: hypothetical protein VHL98_12075 [Microvirga sp.]|jgi:hypothetical protein|nr:hypothetical protein [Microvirga sp.]